MFAGYRALAHLLDRISVFEARVNIMLWVEPGRRELMFALDHRA